MVTINKALFKQRLLSLYRHWQDTNKKALLWGGATGLVIASSDSAHDLTNGDLPAVSVFHLWLFGYELPDTILIFTAGNVHVLASSTKVGVLQPLVSVAAEVDIDMHCHVRPKDRKRNPTDALTQQVQKLLLPHVISAEHPSPLPSTWGTLLGSEKALPILAAVLLPSMPREDVSGAVADLVSVRDQDEVVHQRKAGMLAARVLKDHVLRKVEAAVDEGKGVTHKVLAHMAEQAVLEPHTVNIKLKNSLCDVAYPPVIQSGGMYKPDVTAGSNDNMLHDEGAIVCALGTRYNMYCANIGRTYWINATKKQESEYLALLAAQEAVISKLRNGKSTATAAAAAEQALRNSCHGYLVSKLSKVVGHGIGLKFCESTTLERAGDEGPGKSVNVRGGQVYNVSLSLTGLKDINIKNKQSRTYAIHLADTVLVPYGQGNTAEVLTALCPKTWDKVSYVLGPTDSQQPIESQPPKSESMIKADDLDPTSSFDHDTEVTDQKQRNTKPVQHEMMSLMDRVKQENVQQTTRLPEPIVEGPLPSPPPQQSDTIGSVDARHSMLPAAPQQQAGTHSLLPTTQVQRMDMAHTAPEQQEQQLLLDATQPLPMADMEFAPTSPQHPAAVLGPTPSPGSALRQLGPVVDMPVAPGAQATPVRVVQGPLKTPQSLRGSLFGLLDQFEAKIRHLCSKEMISLRDDLSVIIRHGTRNTTAASGHALLDTQQQAQDVAGAVPAAAHGAVVVQLTSPKGATQAKGHYNPEGIMTHSPCCHTIHHHTTKRSRGDEASPDHDNHGDDAAPPPAKMLCITPQQLERQSPVAAQHDELMHTHEGAIVSQTQAVQRDQPPVAFMQSVHEDRERGVMLSTMDQDILTGSGDFKEHKECVAQNPLGLGQSHRQLSPAPSTGQHVSTQQSPASASALSKAAPQSVSKLTPEYIQAHLLQAAMRPLPSSIEIEPAEPAGCKPHIVRLSQERPNDRNALARLQRRTADGVHSSCGAARQDRCAPQTVTKGGVTCWASAREGEAIEWDVEEVGMGGTSNEKAKRGTRGSSQEAHTYVNSEGGREQQEEQQSRLSNVLWHMGAASLVAMSWLVFAVHGDGQ